MIGNDIVDLHQAKLDSNWQRKGYLDKIFSLEEQQLIMNADDANLMVWRLWTMKEAAYKIHNTKTGVRNFAPVKITCSIIYHSYGLKGFVTIDANKYQTSTEINTNFIHTIATADRVSFHQVKTSIYELPNDLNYRPLNPDCVSHHGKYLALVHKQSGAQF